MYKCCYILVVVFTSTWRCVIWHYIRLFYKCRSLPVYVVIWIFNDCFKQVLESQILQNNHYVETQITWNNCYVESQITQNNHYLQTQITQNNHCVESQITWNNHYVHVQKLYAISPYPEDRIFIELCMWLNDMCVFLLAMKSRWQTLRTTLRPCLQTQTLNTLNSLRFVVSHFILRLLCYSSIVRPKKLMFCFSGTVALLAQILMYWLILFPNKRRFLILKKKLNYILKFLA